MRAREPVEDRQQHDGAHDSDQKGCPVPSNYQQAPGDQRVEPPSNNGTNDANNDITHAAHTGTASSKQTGNPARERTKDQPRKPVEIGNDNIHTLLPFDFVVAIMGSNSISLKRTSWHCLASGTKRAVRLANGPLRSLLNSQLAWPERPALVESVEAPPRKRKIPLRMSHGPV